MPTFEHISSSWSFSLLILLLHLSFLVKIPGVLIFLLSLGRLFAKSVIDVSTSSPFFPELRSFDLEDYVAWVLFTNTKFCIIFHASDFCSWEIPNISIIIFVYFFDKFNSLMNFTILSPILYIFFLTPFWLLWPFPLVFLFVILTLLSFVTAFIQWFIYISCGHASFNVGWSFIPIISGTSAFSYFISIIIGSFFASN